MSLKWYLKFDHTICAVWRPSVFKFSSSVSLQPNQTKTWCWVSVICCVRSKHLRSLTLTLDSKSDRVFKWCHVIRLWRTSWLRWKMNLNIEPNFKNSSEDRFTFLWRSCSCWFSSFSERCVKDYPSSKCRTPGDICSGSGSFIALID